MSRHEILQKLFTDRSIAEAYLGEITQAVYHIIKLEYKFNYKYDRVHHIEDISNWLIKVSTAICKDKSSKGPGRVMMNYMKLINPVSLCNSFTNRLRKKYNYTGRLTLDDLYTAIATVIDILSYNSYDGMILYLNRIYPDDGLRLRRFIQISKK